jgi:hypothetical protein
MRPRTPVAPTPASSAPLPKAWLAANRPLGDLDRELPRRATTASATTTPVAMRLRLATDELDVLASDTRGGPARCES